MVTNKPNPGSEFPALSVYDSNDELVDISKPTGDAKWQMVVVYRHRYCPVCTKHLNKLAGFRQRLLDIGFDMAAVSCDSKEDLEDHRTQLDVNFPLFYGLTTEQAQGLGLYISPPKLPDVEHEFAEPGLFLIDPEGQMQLVATSNNPILRPDLDILVNSLEKAFGS